MRVARVCTICGLLLKLSDSVEQAAGIGYESIWQKRYGEGLAVAYLERGSDPLIIELFENHAGR